MAGARAPIYMGEGNDGSLLNTRVDATSYHGETGLEAPEMRPTHRTPDAESAVAFLVRRLSSELDKFSKLRPDRFWAIQMPTRTA